MFRHFVLVVIASAGMLLAASAQASLFVTITGQSTGSIAGVSFSDTTFGFAGEIRDPGAGQRSTTATNEFYTSGFDTARFVLAGLSLKLTTPLSLVEARTTSNTGSGTSATLAVTDTPEPLNGYHPVLSLDLPRAGFGLAQAFAGLNLDSFTTFASLQTSQGELVISNASSTAAFTFVNPIPPGGILLVSAFAGLAFVRRSRRDRFMLVPPAHGRVGG